MTAERHRPFRVVACEPVGRDGCSRLRCERDGAAEQQPPDPASDCWLPLCRFEVFVGGADQRLEVFDLDPQLEFTCVRDLDLASKRRVLVVKRPDGRVVEGECPFDCCGD